MLSLRAIVTWIHIEQKLLELNQLSMPRSYGSDIPNPFTFIIFKYRVRLGYAVAVFSWVALLAYSIFEYDSSNRAVKPPAVSRHWTVKSM
jgi:hypothetical protein